MKQPVTRTHAKLSLFSSRAFWNCELSAVELTFLAVGVAGSLTLHLDPVLNAGYAKPFLFILGTICFLSPVSGFFFLAASAILPTASSEMYALARELAEAGENSSGIVDAGTKYAFYSWLIVLPIRYRRLELRGVSNFSQVLPWLFWMIITNGLESAIRPDFIKSILFGVMACQLANESEGQYIKCLLGFGLGFMVVTFGYWADVAGLPVTLSDWGGARGGFTRMGSVVVDSVMLWPPLLCGLGAIIAIPLSYGSNTCNVLIPSWLQPLAIIAFFLSIPPLLAAMTNSGIVGLVVLIVVFGFYMATSKQHLTRGKAFSTQWIFLAVLFGVIALIFTNALNLRDRVVSLYNVYQEQSQDIGAAASRNPIWEASLDTISRYPLMGVHFNGGSETIPTEYADRGYFLSHNVFLDYGRSAGIPGMLLFALFFLTPAVRQMKSGNHLTYMPFLLAHLMFLLFFLSLSFQWYKPFWAFWMLTAMISSQEFQVWDPELNEEPESKQLVGAP